MSEQRKLTDDEVDVLCGGVRAVGLGIVADEWRKAREGRRLLAVRLLKRMEEHCPDVGRCIRCQADAALLAEVGG